MTNEQAIKWLKETLKETDFQYEQMEIAVEMAIKALEKVEKYEKILKVACWVVDRFFDELTEDFAENLKLCGDSKGLKMLILFDAIYEKSKENKSLWSEFGFGGSEK